MEPEQNQITKTALVVEDNRICRTILSSHLEQLNYTVDISSDAKTAIQKLFEQTYALIVIVYLFFLGEFSRYLLL